MLSVSRWAQATARLVHDQIGSHATGKSVPSEQKGEYVVELPDLWPSLCTNPLQQVAGLCEPLYSGLHEDVDHITQLLAGLEARYCECESDDEDDEDFAELLERDLVPRARYTSTRPSIPSITVTPCPPQKVSDCDPCRVPFQDYAFGQRLTVPSHPTFNNTHPPQRTLPNSVQDSAIPECYWMWDAGHWEAVLPSLSEQSRRGLYSIPLPPSRRKGARSSGSPVPRRFSPTS
ncbi:hypothetical protein BKA70DRAFT_249491 [Coprinopsis sp. MPI-PUGE-AT-0042]|nr:hypothetical protein BKA70DRAFT_249491 [Coprinopsis sp. MPI-PUGE-AT-0042]